MVGDLMMPIHILLNRLRWDPKFARDDFTLGYYDRVADRVILVPLKEVSFPDHTPNTFRLMDDEGRIHRVPFHRVREVYQDGRRIWQRPRRAE
jgi:uncharacterized protein (UPF0248 family)